MRELLMPDTKPNFMDLSQQRQRQAPLAGWENEGGAGPPRYISFRWGSRASSQHGQEFIVEPGVGLEPGDVALRGVRR